MPLSIAMDGPVGAGKSTVAQRVAQELGVLHLDTGALYRALGLLALRAGVDVQDEKAVSALCKEAHVEAVYAQGRQHTLLNGEDVSALIRTEEVSAAASAVSRWQDVRARMTALQREIAATGDVLLDGRDIGTHVLPHATVKIYLTASAEERARRRCAQYRESGVEADFATVLRDVNARDEQDMNRKVDPLRKAEEAVEVDSTEMTMDEVVREIVALCRAKED